MSEAAESDLTRRRRAARIAAVQALYELDMSGMSSDSALRDFLENRWERLDRDGQPTEAAVDVDFHRGLFTEVVRGTAAALEKLDDILNAALAPARSVGRLETVLRAILRAGAFELTARKSVPARVVIAEYVAIAHAFYSGKEPGLVNGVLDRLARTIRPEEREGSNREPPGEER